MLDFNTEPYNDDFDENNKFYRILFRPSFAVQARELTQLQTILQKQIAQTGNHLFKQGAMVVPGAANLDTDYNYVKLQTYYGSDVVETYVDNFAGRDIIGANGVEATVLKVVHAVGSDETTLYVRYKTSGTDKVTKKFANNEVITTNGGTGTYTVQAIASNAVGVGCAAVIERGVYYVNGYFVLCDAQSIILDKYTNVPTYRVGLTIDEQKITPETTYTSLSTGELVTYDMLLDNAQTSYNYAAPGAHRYYIDLVLTKIPLLTSAFTWTANTKFALGDIVKTGNLYYQVIIAGTTGSTAPAFTSGTATNGTTTLKFIQSYVQSLDVDSDSNFIELITCTAGQVERQVTETAYAQIEKTLARRTMDESGNYTVSPFKIDIREHRNNNRGQWLTSTVYAIGDVVSNAGKTYVASSNGTSGSVAPVHTGTTAITDTSTTGGVLWEYTTNPFYNRGIYSPTDGANPGDDGKLAIGLEPGKAYIEGYEIEKRSTTYVTVDKARVSVQSTSKYLPYSLGNYVLTTNINSLPPFDSATGYPKVTLYNRFVSSVGNAPLSSVTATVAISGSAGQFTCGNSTLAVGDLITITGTKGGTSTFTGYTSGTTYKVSAVTGTSPSVTGFTLTTTSDAALSTSAGTLTGLTYTSVGGIAIGTARIRGIEWDNGTIGTQTAVYKLFLFDVSLTNGYDFNRDVKSFFYSRSDTNLNFSADINNIPTNLIGSATTYSSYPTKGASATLTGIGTAWQGGTSTSPALKVGDYILVNTTSGDVLRRVITLSNNGSIILDSTVTADGGIVRLVTSGLQEPQNSSLIYPLPNYAIDSVRDKNGFNTINYYGMQYLAAQAGAPSGGGVCSLQLSLTAGSGVFASADETDNYVLAYYDATSGGTIVKPSAWSAGNGTTITFTIPDTYAGKDFIAMATILKTGIGEKSKLKTTETVTFTTQAAATKAILSLGKADILRIKSIMMDGGSFTSPAGTYTIDIFDHYDFDNGQRDTHYDLGRLLLKNSFTPPSGPISVTFDWFEHTPGDYFTKNSYQITGSTAKLKVVDVPSYNGVSLRDVIDFRPRIGDGGVTFTGTYASFSITPKRGNDITLDYSYYLSRKDKLAIDKSGKFFNIAGVPALVPGEPLDPAVGMVVYKLTLEPYTFGTSNANIVIDQVDNKRYTMRDIGKLEKRIDNLEYYTSLSLLEQETKSLSVTDSQGLERFKNGFIVDSFTGHNVGNVLSPDYLCSVDMQNGELRPFYTMNNVNLVENKSTDAARLSAGYKLYGDVITLPVKENIPLITQPYASRLENINPFAIFTFLGNIRMNPSSDDWFETARRPDIIRNVEGNFNTIAALATQAGILGTVWNAWQILWMGEPLPVGGSLIQYTTGSNWANARALGEGATYINVDEFNNRFGGASGGGPARQVYVQTTAQQVGRGRTGVKSTLAVQMERQVVDDKVVSTAVIPYIRSRNILVQVKGLKPNTIFYPYFDSTSVSSYCTPASYLTYTLTSGTDFDISKNSGNDATDPARIINSISGKYTADTNGNMCLNVGDRILGSTSSATAVVIGKDYTTDSNGNITSRRLHIVNIKGTFTLGETITAYGTGSDATATISGTMPTNNSQGTALTTNSIGDLNFVFFVPDNDSLKFRTGTREFKLLDVATIDGQQSSSAKVQYQATGILETRQQTINSIRNAHIIQEIVAENDTVTKTIERVARDTGWYDPLAQTFLVQSPGGAFLSKVDIFFATKDDKLPVTLEIREVVNGYPGKRILPFSKVTLNPIDVKKSETTVAMTDGSGASYPSYDTPTTFTFPSPVYVQDGQEYAIVLASDSNNYKVWISQMGDIIPNSNRTISEQPYAGVLFKSQNASTWTANQDQDLKFTIYRCKFDTDVLGAVPFVNDILPINEIDSNPFQTVSATNKVRVWHANHGMFTGSYVQFTNTDAVINGTALSGTLTVSSGSTDVTGGTSGSAKTYFTTELDSSRYVLRRASDNAFVGVISSVTDINHLVLVSGAAIALAGDACKICKPIGGSDTGGIPTTEIYSNSSGTQITHTISDVDLDSYCITVSSSAGRTGYSGGLGVRANSNILFDVAVPSIQSQNFSDTKIDFTMATTSGKSVDGGEVPYTYGTAKGIVPNSNNVFYAPQVVASTINQTAGKTVTLTASISSTNNALSPIIDTHRTSLIAISNKINTPSENNINVSVLDNRTVFTGATGAFSFANVGSAWSASATKIVGDQINYLGNLYTVTIAGTLSGGTGPTHTVGLSTNGTATLLYAGKSTTITSTNASVCALIPTISVGKYITITSATTSGNNGTYLVTGIAGDGSTTGTITIARTSSLTAEAAASGTTVTLRTLFVDEIAPVGSSSVNKYISRAINLANPSNFFRIRYAGCIPSEANVLVYYKTSPVGSTLDLDQINWTLSNPDAPITKVQNGDGTFTDIDYSEEGLAQFDSFAIKIVMQSTNSSAIPRIKDLRIIACA
jgi:hypothetical protein